MSRSNDLIAMTQKKLFTPIARSFGAILLTLFLSGVHASATAISAPSNGLSVRVDETTGNYKVITRNPAWTFAGHFNVPITNVVVNRGSDSVGTFQQIAFGW